MKLPRFVLEMGTESRRRDLLMGIWSGYTLAIGFGILAVGAQLQGLVAWGWQFYALVGAKLVTNTIAYFCWRKRFLALEAGGINVMMDIITMTGAIYATGTQLSPLLPMYIIEIGVLAMLTNLGITLLAASSTVILYTSIAVLVHVHWIPTFGPPVARPEDITHRYLLFGVTFITSMIAAISYYTSFILLRLRTREAQLEARTRELIDAQTQRSQFMANITHELRTPIHGIVGLTELLDDGVYGPVTEKQHDACNGVHRSAKALLALIDDLLQLARGDAGRLEFRPSNVSIRELVESIVPSIRWMLGHKDVQLRVNCPDDLPTVATDRGKLGQVLINLLSNAIKFTPEGGTVTLDLDANPDGVIIEVSDNGIGIPQEELPHIFDAFRQVDGSAARKYGGAGLGLAVVRQLADVLSATVTVASEEGKGSKFCVRVPLLTGSVAAAA